MKIHDLDGLLDLRQVLFLTVKDLQPYYRLRLIVVIMDDHIASPRCVQICYRVLYTTKRANRQALCPF